jgi:Rad3-related DNA helicase
VETEDYAIYAESSFDAKNRLIAIGNDVSTKYTKRSQTMYQKYAEYIVDVIAAKKGNYLVFFPSYLFMEKVWDAFEKLQVADVECIRQEQYMNEQEREEFLNKYSVERDDCLLGFCVLGGIFSEGIDLTHERLIGAIVVGTGLPQVCNEREILKQHFDKRKENGFDYAYLYPAMNKVLQAAGRVIRTEQDIGVIALLDERFGNMEYRRIFPREWNNVIHGNSVQIKEQLREFWDEKGYQ